MLYNFFAVENEDLKFFFVANYALKGKISFLMVGGGGFLKIEKNFFYQKSCIGVLDIP